VGLDVFGKLVVTNKTIPFAGLLGREQSGGNAHTLLKQHSTKSL
jgi:hypothetical protein